MRSLRTSIGSVARSPIRAFVVVFLVAFSLRAYLLTKIPEQYVRPHDRFEMEAIAMSLATTGEFANPYAIPTGPTAHVPPVYPWLVSVFYRIAGTSLAAGYVRWLFDMAMVSAAFALLPWLGTRLGVGAPAGLIAGLAGALYLRWLCQVEQMAAIGIGLLMVALVRRWSTDEPGVASSVLIGLGFGIVFHVKPEALTVFAGCIAFELWWRRRARPWRPAAVMVLAAALACVPWTLRNWTVFHSAFFVRSNFGLELRVGNHEGSTTDVEAERSATLVHPRTDVDEALRVRELGEIEYMRAARREAVDWIRGHPGRYASLVVRRFVAFWFGSWHDPLPAFATLVATLLAILGAWSLLPRLSAPQRAALLIPLATFPAVYYLIAFMPRYRIPVEWIVMLLAASAVVRWTSRTSDGQTPRER